MAEASTADSERYGWSSRKKRLLELVLELRLHSDGQATSSFRVASRDDRG